LGCSQFVDLDERVKPRLSQTLTRGARPDSNSRPVVQISSPLLSRYAPWRQPWWVCLLLLLKVEMMMLQFYRWKWTTWEERILQDDMEVLYSFLCVILWNMVEVHFRLDFPLIFIPFGLVLFWWRIYFDDVLLCTLIFVLMKSFIGFERKKNRAI